MKTRIKKYIFASLVVSVFLLFVNACSTKNPFPNNNRNAIEDALKEGMRTNRALKHSQRKKFTSFTSLQKNILMPELSVPNGYIGDGKKIEQRFDIAVNNVPAKDFFMGLTQDTKYNMMVNPEIKGNLTLKLKDVTIQQAMDAARDTYGFEYEKTSYGYKVFPLKLETRIFQINYLDLDRDGQSQTTIGSGQITSTIQSTLTASGEQRSRQAGSIPSGLINTSSKTQFWETLKNNLDSLVGDKDGRSVAINKNAGSVIIKAYPNELRYVAKYLDNVQNIIHRQVIIEAKIIEVELNAEFQNGINWKVLGLEQNSVINDFANSSDEGIFGDASGILSLKATSGNAFRSVIKLLNNQGNANVLSSPRIATINNQKAVIKVGEDRFFVTDVSSDTSTAGGTSSTTADITLTPFFSGISLDVTPQIDENDNITIHIHPIISQVSKIDEEFVVNDKEQNLPLARSTVREADSVVRAKNGQVIVIGGLMASSGRDYGSSTPGADRLPGIGGLFKNKKKSSRKFELVILLRPVLAKTTKDWQKQLHNVYNNIREMKGDFSYNIVPEKTKPKLRKLKRISSSEVVPTKAYKDPNP